MVDYNAQEWGSLREAALSEAELASLERIYTESFPPEERRPWGDLLEGRDHRFGIRLLRHEGQVCGFATFWRLRSAIFVEHLVVSSALRGQGLGAKAIQGLLNQSQPQPLMLEIEPSELSPEAMRRQTFYQRMGLHLLDIDYIQPPYVEGGCSVRLRLMSSRELEIEQIKLIVDELRRVVYGQTQ